MGGRVCEGQRWQVSRVVYVRVTSRNVRLGGRKAGEARCAGWEWST